MRLIRRGRRQNATLNRRATSPISPYAQISQAGTTSIVKKLNNQNLPRFGGTPLPRCRNEHALNLPFSAVPPVASSSKQLVAGLKQDRRQFLGGCDGRTTGVCRKLGSLLI